MVLIHLIRQCARFRELLLAFMGRELKARYRGSVLGPAWMILQPLLYLAVYFVVFAKLLQTKGIEGVANRPDVAEAIAGQESAYGALLMLCGLIPWLFIAETVVRGTGVVLENGSLLKKFAFPTELLPVYLVGVAMTNTLVAFGIMVPVSGFLLGIWPERIYLLPVILTLQACFLLGLTYFLSAATVFLRDLLQMIPMFTTFVFFLTPIFYARPPAPEFEWVLRANPVTYLIDLYRAVFLRYPGTMAETFSTEAELGVFGAISITLLVLGLTFFRALKPRFADEV